MAGHTRYIDHLKIFPETMAADFRHRLPAAPDSQRSICYNFLNAPETDFLNAEAADAPASQSIINIYEAAILALAKSGTPAAFRS